MNALGAGRGSARIRFRPGPIELVIVEAPFPDISRHVFNSKGTGPKRKCADGRAFRVAIVDVAIAPGKNGVAIGEIGEIAAAVIVSPWKFSIVDSFGGVFPFRFRRQTIFAAFACAQPLTKFHGIEIADVNDWMAIARPGCALGPVRAIKLLVISIRDQTARDVKAAQRDLTEWALVRRGVLYLASHREFSRRNENHHFAKSVCEIAVTRTFQVCVALNLFRRRLLLDWSRSRNRLRFGPRTRARLICKRFLVGFL